MDEAEQATARIPISQCRQSARDDKAHQAAINNADKEIARRMTEGDILPSPRQGAFQPEKHNQKRQHNADAQSRFMGVDESGKLSHRRHRQGMQRVLVRRGQKRRGSSGQWRASRPSAREDAFLPARHCRFGR